MLDARQYTHAIPEAIERVRSGENPVLKKNETHWRECFIALKEAANKDQIINEIIAMKGYFEPYVSKDSRYGVKINFVTKEELEEVDKERGRRHDGLVIAVNSTGNGNKCLIEYKNEWENNPEATAQIMIAYARAAHRLNEEGFCDVRTVKDVPIELLSPKSSDELIRML